MIFDRTQEDIDKAKEIIEDKIKIRYHEDTGTFAPNNTEPLTEEEKAILEKGTYNKKTILRIENAFKELKEALVTNGYDVCGSYRISNIETKDFADDYIFELSDFERWSENLYVLRMAWWHINGTPDIPYSNYTHYETTNTIEKILDDVLILKNGMIKAFNYCGDIVCGGVL